MPAGSGPQVITVTGVATAADTAEHVLATLAGLNWNNPTGLGNLVTLACVFTGAAAGTVTIRVRQSGLAGAQVGVNVPITASAGGVNLPGMEFQDASAFATGPQQGAAYVLTYQQSAASLGTFTAATLECETAAPVA